MERRLVVVLLVAAAVVSINSFSRGQAGRAFTTNFTLQEFAARRAHIYDAIGPEAIALIQGAPTVHSAAVFRQSNEFFYLSGVVAPQALLLMDGAERRSVLYLPKQNAERAATEGELLSSDNPAAAAAITGVEEVKSPDALAADLQSRTKAKAIYVPFAPSEGASESWDGALRRTQDVAADPWDARISREGHLRELLKTRAPALEQKDLSPILNEMRAIKSPAEIALITRATKIGGEAIMEAMRSTAPGLAEYEIDSVAQFIFTRHGAQGEAYRDIVASGPVAMNGHHRASDKIMKDGELLLMDYCPDLGYYRCDVTREWPVNGKFSPVQRELYGFYLGIYEAVLYSIKPNLTAQQILKNALPKMDAMLAASKFSKPLYAREAKALVDRYRAAADRGAVWASLGHGVGMATHDFGNATGLITGLMKPGMVFTIEPDFQIPEDQIDIRLEDMIVITNTGATILSDFVPRGIVAVEKLVAEPGLLQRYGRIK